MSGTSLTLLAMYATVDVVQEGSNISVDTLPYLIALLMVAAALTCAAMTAQLQLPQRVAPAGARLHRLKRFHGPGERRR